MNSPLLTLKKYKPDFQDPRTTRRTVAVLEWCKPLLLSKQPKPVSSAVLTKVFGNQKNDLAAYLRYLLLEQSGTYQPGKHSYSYSIKREGYARLAAAVGLVVKDDAEIAKELYGGIAQGTEQPEYTEPVAGARRYHAVQNLPKKLRAEVFKGWYDYDIEAAAPTLVYQAACEALTRMGMRGDKAPYPHIEQLVKDRTKVRQYLGELTGLDSVAVKQVLIALFFGSKLVPSPKRAIFRILGSDYELVQRLKADPFIKEFCKEVQLMWSAVIASDNSKKGMAVIFGGAEPVAKPSKKSKHRMAIYLELERKVMDVVDSELRSQGVLSVLIHDGFMTKTRIDRAGLEDLVEKKTGYRVKLSESQVGKQDENSKLGLDEELIELDEEVL